jgi:predicted RND superfamily exporter protein
MRLLGRYERAIARKPWVAIILVLLVTMFMAYSATNVDSGFEDDDFRVDNDIAQANDEVQERFGSQVSTFTVLIVAEDNALSRDVLLVQLELEERLTDARVQEVLVRTPENPTGIANAVDLVAQAAFLTEGMEAADQFVNDTDNNGTGAVAYAEFFEMMANLTIDERRTIIEGGSLELNLSTVPVPVVLEYEPYEPSMLPAYLKGTPFKEVLPFLLSEDYKDGERTSAAKSIFSLAVQQDLEPERSLEIEEELEGIVASIEESHEGLELRFIGDQLIGKAIDDASGASIGIIMTLAMVLIVVVLAVVYRNMRDTVFNLLALVFAIVWVYGFGALVGFNFNPMTITVPVLLVGLGIDYGIHLTLRYREEVRKGNDISDAIGVSGSTVGFAITIATLTTVMGFLSNVTSDVSTIREFGILAAFGIFSAFVLMMTFFPALKIVSDRRRLAMGKPIIKEKVQDKRSIFGWSRNVPEYDPSSECPIVCASGVGALNNLAGLGAVATRRPVVVIGVIVVVTVASLWGASQLEARFGFSDFLPEDLEITESFNMLVDDFDFSRESAYIYVEGDLADPEVFLTIKEVQDEALGSRHAVLTDPVESPLELGRAMADPMSPRFDPGFQQVWLTNADTDGDGVVDPGLSRANVTAIYAALFKYGPDQAGRVLAVEGDGYGAMVIRVPVNSRNGEVADELTEDMEEAISPMKDFDGGAVSKVVATGPAIVSYTVQESISTGQTRSMILITIISLLILTGLYLYLKRSFTLGAVTLLPLLFVIAWGFGGMFLIGVPFNVVTVTIAAITVGLGIDYAIHVTQRFTEDLETLPDSDCAICVAVSHTGTALFGSAATTVVGFGLLSLSIVPPLAQFGKVTALNIFLAFVASVFVLPTFLILWWRGKQRLINRSTSKSPTTSKSEADIS